MVFRRRDRRPIKTIVSEFFLPRGGWSRAAQYVVHRLSRLPDPPHRIARGIFAGVFISFTPFFGFHFLGAAAIAWSLRGNILAALLATFFGNPLTTPLGDETEDGWEGCLSVPGLRGLVPRSRHIRYQGCDENGQPIDRTVSGFHARVVQHECDHLQGVLYPMRIRDLSRFGFTDVLFPGLE